MIENTGDMADLTPVDQLDATQQKVQVLGSLEPETESTDALNQTAAVDGHVADVVLRRDHCRIPIRLEQRTAASALSVEFVLVRIEDRSVRMLVDFVDEPEE